MSGKNILIIEDNPKSMRLIRMLLKNCGYIVYEANDGTTGLKIALQIHPDLIIMDIQLPEISGIDVIIKLRNTRGFEKTPIIALTAYAMKGESEKILASGCTAYLSKPINTRQFPKQIEHWLNNGDKNN